MRRIESYSLIICVAILSITSGVHSQIASQVHLSLGEQPYEIVATWSTPLPTKFSVARYGLSGGYPANSIEVSGWQADFVDNGTLQRIQFIHRVSFSVLPSVRTSTLYYYQVWNDTDWSTLFSFRVPAVTPTPAIYFVAARILHLRCGTQR
jgi:hypothetical protein